MSEEIESIDGEMSWSDTPIAYVRAVRKEDLRNPPENLPDGLLYALHDENGRPLAVFKDRVTAMAAARCNDFRPVSVH